MRSAPAAAAFWAEAELKQAISSMVAGYGDYGCEGVSLELDGMSLG